MKSRAGWGEVLIAHVSSTSWKRSTGGFTSRAKTCSGTIFDRSIDLFCL